MTFNEFLGLVIALVLLYFLIIVPSVKYFNLYGKQQYINSYNNLNNKVNDIANSELEESSDVLAMNEKSYIAFFSKEAGKIEFSYFSGEYDITDPTGYTITKEFILNKPINEQCNNKACSCLCTEYEEKEAVNYLGRPAAEIICKKQICNSFEDIDFSNSIDGSSISTIISNGGFIIENKLTNIPNPKSGTVYIKKEDKLLRICRNNNCKSSTIKLQ